MTWHSGLRLPRFGPSLHFQGFITLHREDPGWAAGLGYRSSAAPISKLPSLPVSVLVLVPLACAGFVEGFAGVSVGDGARARALPEQKGY